MGPRCIYVQIVLYIQAKVTFDNRSQTELFVETIWSHIKLRGPLHFFAHPSTRCIWQAASDFGNLEEKLRGHLPSESFFALARCIQHFSLDFERYLFWGAI